MCLLSLAIPKQKPSSEGLELWRLQPSLSMVNSNPLLLALAIAPIISLLGEALNRLQVSPIWREAVDWGDQDGHTRPEAGCLLKRTHTATSVTTRRMIHTFLWSFIPW